MPAGAVHTCHDFHFSIRDAWLACCRGCPGGQGQRGKVKLCVDIPAGKTHMHGLVVFLAQLQPALIAESLLSALAQNRPQSLIPRLMRNWRTRCPATGGQSVDFSQSARRVAAPEYRAIQDYRTVAVLPMAVLKAPAIVARAFTSDAVFISDQPWRHGLSSGKAQRGAALPESAVFDLPRRLDSARWVRGCEARCGFFHVKRP